jgi:hypothetical protein
MATACAGNAPPYLPRLDPNHPPDGDNHLPTDERHPGRYHSEWPADMSLESVADIAPEQAADIIGIRTEVAEWNGGPFDPDVVEVEEHAQALAALAKQWSRKTTTSRKRAT